MIEKLREELIKDILTYLEDKEKLQFDHAEVTNTITQIIVDAFDEYEYDNNPKKESI